MKIHLDESLPSTSVFELENEFWEYYLSSVRRFQAGDRLEISAPDQVASVEVINTDPFQVQVHDTRPANQPPYELWLIQAITRKKKFEESVKIGTELGVTDFIPLISNNTVRRPNNPEKQKRRWRKISMDSTRISGRDWTPTIHSMCELTGDFSVPDVQKCYIGDADGESPSDLFMPDHESAAIFVGPEGGFTSEEVNVVRENFGGFSVALGTENFRAETASIAFASIWLNRTGHLP